ncbi:MAG: GerMN domain-containing protein [Clostridiales bacterium]|nr:GerMN domain-containing protein [Clostridiales bacterium]
MKKYMMLVCLVMSGLLLTGCGKNGKDTEGTPTPSPTMPIEQENPEPSQTPEQTEEGNVKEAAEESNDNTNTIKDYFPPLKDTTYIYEGVGMEYASFTVFMDYFDEEDNRYQTRTDNGGTVTVKVLEINDGKLSVIKSIGEAYYRDNILDTKPEKHVDVLLKEPLVKGTNWTTPDGSERYISNTNVKVESDLGTYDTIEVTTKREDSTTKEYYAKGVGMVKSVFKSDDYEVSSTLSAIKKETPRTQIIEVFYPGKDEKIHVEQISVNFHTNDITRIVLEKAVKEEVLDDNYLPLISSNTKINSLYLGKDNIVYVDFSKEFIEEMNAGSGYEVLILQSIVNTLGNYYGVEKVYITVDEKVYESGHILLKQGETLEVNMEAVVREE